MTGMTPGETGPYELPDPGSSQFVRDAAEAQRENRIHDLARLSIRRVRELHHKIADLEGENERIAVEVADLRAQLYDARAGNERLKAAITVIADEAEAEAASRKVTLGVQRALRDRAAALRKLIS